MQVLYDDYAVTFWGWTGVYANFALILWSLRSRSEGSFGGSHQLPEHDKSWRLRGSGGANIGTIIGYVLGLDRDCYMDPLPHSPEKTRKTKWELNYRLSFSWYCRAPP